MRALSNTKEKIILRRSKVIELYSKGLSENEMSKALNIPRSPIGSDIRVMRQLARTNVQTFIEERLPWEHESLMTGVKQVLKRAWSVLEDEHSSEKAVVNAMHIILRCYEFKRQLLIDGIDSAIGVRDFVESKQAELEGERYRLALEEKRARSEAVF